VICTVTLAIAGLALWNARRYVGLVEDGMEHLRAEQARLLAALREELRGLKEELIREQEEHPGSQRRAERLRQECLRLRQEKSQLTEELERERVKREEVQQRVRQEREGRELERRARRDAERRIDRLNRESRETSQDREVGRETPSIVLEGSSEELPTARELPEKPLPPPRRGRETEKLPQPPSPSEKAAPEPSKVSPEDERPRLGRWVPHPDDGDAGKGWASAGQERARSEDPVEMFRKHYDKYLDSYEGYLELIGMLYRMRDDNETKSDSLEEREWENRLRRASDGIKRTTVRLDTLEEYNPELATDDRVSRRVGLARRHSELERSGQDRTGP
jgi:hypothetical protein